MNCLKLSALFLSSPHLRRTQRVVGNVYSITRETADQDNPFCPVFVNLPPVDLAEWSADVLSLIACSTLISTSVRALSESAMQVCSSG
ncbi:MAG: hypothetical protein WCE81_02185 [Halobacteriota archaeon]